MRVENTDSDLSIEWVVVEKVSAVELLAVGLDQRDPVLSPLENLHLVHRGDVGPGEVSLSGDENLAVSVLQSDSLVVISILDLTTSELHCSHRNHIIDKLWQRLQLTAEQYWFSPSTPTTHHPH